jgi:hypothetical protein
MLLGSMGLSDSTQLVHSNNQFEIMKQEGCQFNSRLLVKLGTYIFHFLGFP